MTSMLVRLGIVLVVFLLTAALIQAGRLFVARQRRLALAATPPAELPAGNKLRILAFSSADCLQCRRLQQPALRRLQALHGTAIDVLEIDAPASPDLAGHYHILTVPSTVILSPKGEALAINYGFVPLETLQAQIDAALPPVVTP
jgi:hypothetical protein